LFARADRQAYVAPPGLTAASAVTVSALWQQGTVLGGLGARTARWLGLYVGPSQSPWSDQGSLEIGPPPQ